MNRMGRPRSSRLCLLSLSLISLTVLLVFPSSIGPVLAAGNLFVGPTPQVPFSVGTIFTYQVNVTAMDPFDSWDVVVQADSNVLDPLSISVAGNMLGSVTPVANCVNGGGSGCTIKDNKGGGHSPASIFSTPISGRGLLFSIKYKAGKEWFPLFSTPHG